MDLIQKYLKFQYILCFGSSEETYKSFAFKAEFQYILCFGSISSHQNIYHLLEHVSIHPMFRFKIKIAAIKYVCDSFQYILCFGSRSGDVVQTITLPNVSIHPMFRFKGKFVWMIWLIVLRFNTSYVSVQEFIPHNIFPLQNCFNTSYVSVQEFIPHNIFPLQNCFNTSYVSVQV